MSDTHCVDVVDDPKGLGEQCHLLMGDSLGGFDDCGPGLFCYGIDLETSIGQCVGFCLGSIESPQCESPAALCVLCGDCAAGLCLGGCHPLEQDCGMGELCVPNPDVEGYFMCVIDASGEEGQAFDSCDFLSACDPGLFCGLSDSAVECDPMASGCCIPFCNLAMPMCPGVGQECLPWSEMEMGPPGYEDLGVCGLPP